MGGAAFAPSRLNERFDCNVRKDKNMEMYDVVMKLVGPTRPVGETYEDARRFENLAVLTRLVDRLMTEIHEIATENTKRQEYSMKRAGEFCGKFLDNIGIV